MATNSNQPPLCSAAIEGIKVKEKDKGEEMEAGDPSSDLLRGRSGQKYLGRAKGEVAVISCEEHDKFFAEGLTEEEKSMGNSSSKGDSRGVGAEVDGQSDLNQDALVVEAPPNPRGLGSSMDGSMDDSQGSQHPDGRSD